MSRSVRFDAAAERELNEAIDFYDLESPGLGDVFLAEVERALTQVAAFPESAQAFLFPVALLAGGAVAGLMGLIVAVPSFKTRGDYLAIVTLAFLMIVKSVIENIDAIGGPRGFLGMT